MDILKSISIYPYILTTDFLRYFIAAGLGYIVFWVLLKKVLKHRFIQNHFPKTSIMLFEFRYSMSTVIIFSIIGFIIHLMSKAGLTQIYHDKELYGYGYMVLSFLILVLFHDTYFYWTHRWMHLPKIYKIVHKVHHKSTNPSPWAAYSFHPLEALVQAIVLPIMIFTIPLHPGVIVTFLIFMIIRNVQGHLGFELFPKGFTKNKWWSWHTTTTHHNMHHNYFNYNYGLYFSWWDNIMKTIHPEYDDLHEKVCSRKENESLNSLEIIPNTENKKSV